MANITAKMVDDTKVITGKVRLSYAHVLEPASINGSDPKYSVCLLIDKKDKSTVDCINQAIEAAKMNGKKSCFSGKIPPNLKLPLRDGDVDRPEDANYEGVYFLNANSSTKPGIIDIMKNEITDEEDIYSGCYARASINFYAFNKNGNRGIACGLNNIQKLADGGKLAGRASAGQDFDDDIAEEYMDDEPWNN